MKTLARTALKPESHAEPLANRFTPFVNAGIELRRGEMIMFAAPPASAKSFLTLKLLQLIGAPTLYFSADTSMTDQMERASAIATGHKQMDVRSSMLMGGEDYSADELADTFGHIRWVSESDPTYEDLELEVMAYAEAFGRYPEIIVCDNLVNFIGDGESEYAGQKETTRVMKRLVAITNCSLWLLHHMNEKKSDPSYPAPRVDIANKLAQLPNMILSLATDSDQEIMRAAVVKQRTGKQDPSAQRYIEFYTDLDRGRFFTSRQAREVGHAI